MLDRYNLILKIETDYALIVYLSKDLFDKKISENDTKNHRKYLGFEVC